MSLSMEIYVHVLKCQGSAQHTWEVEYNLLWQLHQPTQLLFINSGSKNNFQANDGKNSPEEVYYLHALTSSFSSWTPS